MAKNRRNRPAPATPGTSRSTPENRAIMPGLAGAPAAAPAERDATDFQLVAGKLQQDTEDKVRRLMAGIKNLKAFKQSHAAEEGEEGEHDEFFKEHDAEINSLLHMNLQDTYQQLVANADARTRLYAQFVQKGVITQAELDTFLGKVTNQPYLQAITTIKARAVVAPAVALADDDVNRLRNATPENLEAACNDLRTAQKLTDADVTSLRDLGPKTAEQLAEARRQISIKIQQHDIAHGTTFATQYAKSLRAESQLNGQLDAHTDQFNTILRSLAKQIQEAYDRDQAGQQKASKIRSLCQETGLPIRKGTVLYAESWSIDPTLPVTDPPHTNRVEILDITFGSALEDSDLHPDIKVHQLSFEPIIHFSAAAPDGSGRIINQQLTSREFRRWLVTNNVCEKFENVAHLEKSLGIDDVLKVGQTLEYYTTKAVGEEQQTEINQVKITNIGTDFIELDQPVVLDKADKGIGLTTDRKAQKLSFGDFARWYRRLHTVPHINKLSDLDKILVNHHRILCEEMKWKPGTGKPISLLHSSKPLLLVSAYDPNTKNFLEITEAKDDKITFADGRVMTPTEFLHLANRNGLMNPTPKMMKELHDLADHKRDEAEKAKTAEYMKRYNMPVPAEESRDQTSAKAKDKPHTVPHDGYFKSLWKKTTFLSLMDIYELFIKAPIDRIKEYQKDQRERGQYTVGKEFYKGIPFLGLGKLSSRYEDQLNGKIATDVKNLEEYYDKNKSVTEVLEILYTAPDLKILKASLQFLSKKGALRWEDDPKLWAILNKRLGGIPYPKKFEDQVGGANVPVVIGDGKAYDINDQYRILMDKEWGEGTFDSLNGANERQYNTEKEGAAKKMHERYEYHGGIEFHLKKMLNDFENGVPINEAEFEGLLTQAIADVEVNIEKGMFLFICAFGMRRKGDGRSLLSWSRLNTFVPALREHAMYIYFALNYPQRDDNLNIIMTQNEKGESVPKEGKFSLNNFRYLYETVVKKDMAANGQSGAAAFVAGKHTINWIQSEVLLAKTAKQKIAEKAGNPNQNIATYQYLGPTLYNEADINKLISTGYGALSKPDIPKNTYAGFNNQLIIRANRLNNGKSSAENEARAREFGEMVYGFLYFNHVMRGKIYKKSGRFMTMDKVQYDTNPQCDKYRKVGEFATETEAFMKKLAVGVAEMSGDSELESLTQEVLFTSTPETPVDEDTEKEFRNKLEENILKLNKSHPQEFAAMASSAALETMKGMSGASFTKEEMDKAAA